jgi:hypothetical protein
MAGGFEPTSSDPSTRRAHLFSPESAYLYKILKHINDPRRSIAKAEPFTQGQGSVRQDFQQARNFQFKAASRRRHPGRQEERRARRGGNESGRGLACRRGGGPRPAQRGGARRGGQGDVAQRCLCYQLLPAWWSRPASARRNRRARTAAGAARTLRTTQARAQQLGRPRAAAAPARPDGTTDCRGVQLGGPGVGADGATRWLLERARAPRARRGRGDGAVRMVAAAKYTYYNTKRKFLGYCINWQRSV